MTRYKITLEYDGRNTVGWQAQGAGADLPSIQGLVQEAMFQFCKRHVEVSSAGRTDAGVHAIAMAASFDLENTGHNPDTIMRAMNFYLRQMAAPVSVLSCESVADDFHARFSCKRRNYRYIILNRRAPVILDNGMTWWIPRDLDIEKMRAAAAKLLGNHDWTSFRSSECQSKSPVKTLDRADIEICDMAFGESGEMQGRYIIMNFSAKSFLHHQVRNIVGTLVDIGLGKPHDIDKIFASKSRAAAGPTAPAYGLYFVSAEY
ncbi:MAG: tRNA pseudouridine(38-40) synthase TruA [Rickettsiales bacterium]|jgi:tRNA pseudouridine38-40 synthase|nr:tRNA pseudouridine(38-40) synthase TruA [Rickettsiales bacterium]